MNRTLVPRALLLAGLLAAAGAAHGALVDEDASEPSDVSTQTWFFPDGSSHTVTLSAQARAPAAPDTSVMGAGPAWMDDEASDQASNTVTQTWFFPDGSSHTVRLAAAPQAPSETSVMGAGSVQR